MKFCIGMFAAFVATLPSAPAAAQGFDLSVLFGGAPQRQRQYVPPQASAYSDPYAPAPERSSTPSGSGTGRSLAYCVRLCDGRYFPMQRHANATSIQLCNAFCPTTKTQVFNGSQIDHAVANNGARYADLDNAFVYREKVIPSCTCNGKDAFGLSKIDIANDPTLRPGDIVSSGDNVKVALTAMAASKERREAANEPPALRGSSARRSATRSGAAAQAEAPAAIEERPED
jgi:hypothetical protein